MKILDLLKGKVVNILTDAKVVVQLTIESVKEEPHSVNLEPSTAANDWWPATRDWKTYDVTFTNGFVKSYHSLNEIEFFEN